MYGMIVAGVRLAVAVWLALLLAGCSVYSLPGQQEPAPPPPTTTPPPPPVPEQPAPPARDPNASNAYGGLVDKATAARSRGDYEQALALLERAQRIDPDSGEIYLELARTYAAKGDDASARATAERGLLYCRDDECAQLKAFTR
jgi:tetratricopeptide (TPR) repeat protein